MPKVNKIIQSLNAGELSPLMDFRIDQQKYQAGCRTMENFYPLIYGGAERRSGTYYVGEAKDSTVKCRIVSFIHSIGNSYILEFGNQYMRVFRDGGRFVGALYADTTTWANSTDYINSDLIRDEADTTIYRCLIDHTSAAAATTFTQDRAANPTYWTAADLTDDLYPIYELVTPYLTADLYKMKFEHSADVSFITCDGYEPRKLSRINTCSFTLEVTGFITGPFLDENTDSTATITANGTTGSVTLTATGCTPFVDGTTAGHEPSGSLPTSKSQTGALFKIIHSMATMNVDYKFTATGQQSATILVYKGVHWDFVTNGTWTGTITLYRSYTQSTWNAGVGWEQVHACTSEDNANTKTDMTEDQNDAYYIMASSGTWDGTSNSQFMVRDHDHIGIVKITAVASTTSATATVVKTLANTTATARWAEGAWSNYRGWPYTVAISPEDRLMFGGSPYYPLNIWGTKSGDYTDMTAGDIADDAIVSTITGNGEQNRIMWMLSKGLILIGTYGGEIKYGSPNQDDPLTPTSPPTAKMQSTYGSADIQAIIVNDAVLFVQRGGRKVREMSYSYEKDSFVAEDLTVFANHITESGILDMAFQRTPDPMLWCVKTDGQCAVMCREKAQTVLSWVRVTTRTLVGESDIESVAVVPTTSEEDSVWFVIERVINGATKRYIEYLAPRNY